MTPHILVDAQYPGVRVPPHTVKDGRVVLNIADRAVAKLELDNEAVRFTARFGGVSHPVYVPVSAVLAIYARETGQGGSTCCQPRSRRSHPPSTRCQCLRYRPSPRPFQRTDVRRRSRGRRW